MDINVNFHKQSIVISSHILMVLHNLSSYFIQKYGQLVDAELNTPAVVIQPMEPVINKAVNLLKRMEPNYFQGVRRIQVSPASIYYGFVESGQQKDPSVVNINMGKIKQEGGNDETAAVIAAATTIAHEVGHVKSYNQQQGFVGGESPAEAEERRVADWIKQNQGRLQDLLG